MASFFTTLGLSSNVISAEKEFPTPLQIGSVTSVTFSNSPQPTICLILLHTLTSILPPWSSALQIVPISLSPHNSNETCGLGNYCPAASRCEIQTLPHV